MNLIFNSYNLYDIDDFPTRNLTSIIDHVIMDSRLEVCVIVPFINGISDHDGQLLSIYNIQDMRREDKVHIIKKCNKPNYYSWTKL